MAASSTTDLWLICEVPSAPAHSKRRSIARMTADSPGTRRPRRRTDRQAGTGSLPTLGYVEPPGHHNLAVASPTTAWLYVLRVGLSEIHRRRRYLDPRVVTRSRRLPERRLRQCHVPQPHRWMDLFVRSRALAHRRRQHLATAGRSMNVAPAAWPRDRSSSPRARWAGQALARCRRNECAEQRGELRLRRSAHLGRSRTRRGRPLTTSSSQVKNAPFEPCLLPVYPIVDLFDQATGSYLLPSQSPAGPLGADETPTKIPTAITLPAGSSRLRLARGNRNPPRRRADLPGVLVHRQPARFDPACPLRQASLPDCSGFMLGPFALGFNGESPTGEVIGTAPPCAPPSFPVTDGSAQVDGLARRQVGRLRAELLGRASGPSSIRWFSARAATASRLAICGRDGSSFESGWSRTSDASVRVAPLRPPPPRAPCLREA